METVTVKTADGVCYRAADSGHESSEAIVCLHGFTGSKESWMFLRGMFPGERMVMIDCLGHGETDAPVQAARYSASRQVADLAAVFDQLKLHKVKLIGYSMGEDLRIPLHRHFRIGCQRLFWKVQPRASARFRNAKSGFSRTGSLLTLYCRKV